MDIIKDPRITKAARGVVCLFSFLTIIGAFVFLFSNSASAGMALAMSIVTLVFSLAAAALAYFSKNNFIFSVVGGCVSLIQLVMGIVLGSTLSVSGRLNLLIKPGGYIFAAVMLIILSGLVIGINAIGVFAKSEQSFIDGVRNMSQQAGQPQQMMMSAQMQTQQMMQQMQQMQPQQMQQTFSQQPMMPGQQPFPQQNIQQGYPQQMPYPQQAQQPYPQQAQQPYPQQAQQPYPQQAQQPYPQQAQQPYPQQGQQYQQSNNFNQQ